MVTETEPVELTPAEFEKQVETWLRGLARQLTKFDVTHLKMLEGPSGEYEIDIVVELEVFQGASIVILVECKHYKDPIKRDLVMILDAKAREVGAHKGMMFSTSRFQKGAVRYAQVHGIATAIVQDGKAAYQTKALDTRGQPPPWYPDYKFIAWMITLTEEGNERHRLIADDYLEAIKEWL